MLDDFSSLKVDAKKPAAAPEPVAAAAAPAAAAASADEANLENLMSDDDFAKQLQAGMADLLGELESSVSSLSLSLSVWVHPDRPCLRHHVLTADSQPEMQAQFDSIFKELGAAAASGEIPVPETSAKAAPSGGAGTPGGAGSASFQDTIRQTMERMQASGEQATAAASAEGSDDFLAELMKQMESGGLGGGGEGGEEDFSKMLLGMMEQLTNKEILYEPMKELNDKFPEWLEKNRDKTPEADLKRYEEQQALVKEIVAKFDQPTFSDANAEDRQYIVDRMQKVSWLALVSENFWLTHMADAIVWLPTTRSGRGYAFRAGCSGHVR